MTSDEFRLWFRDNLLSLYEIASYRLKNHPAAAAAAQRVVVKLYWYWKGESRYERLDSDRPDGYVLKKLRFLVIDEVRARAEPTPQPFPEPVPGPPTPASATGRQEAFDEHQLVKQKCVFLLRGTIEDLTDDQRRVYATCWEAGIKRCEALNLLGLLDAESNDQQREYDQPLYWAKNKLGETLAPYRRFRDSLSFRWLGLVIYQLCCGEEPTMQCPDDCEVCNEYRYGE